MNLQTMGYRWLIDRYRLAARSPSVAVRIDPKVKGRKSRRVGNDEIQVFEPKYKPADTLTAQLQFALRYEGLNLEVLSLLFDRAGADDIDAWLAESPESVYARRAGYLFEWLTGRTLNPAVPPKTRYVPLLDTALQFGVENGIRDSRYRVVDNLPGTPDFCPLVRRTAYLDAMVNKDLRARTQTVLAAYDPDLLRRAAAFLYLRETQSSFEVEREKPSTNRAQRFADLLRQADTGEPLTEERLVELQHTVVDDRFHEFAWRHRQNWIGKDHGHRQLIDFVPPRPADVPRLMRGLLATAARQQQMDAVALAATIAFGFVFIHPFMDGNGRIHRYLIHDVLAKAGFTPRGIVLPVSAVILANLDDYIAALAAFSKPLLTMTDWDPLTPDVPARGNDAIYYRYYDATPQAEFLYGALERTVEHDLQSEIDYLLGFDRAHTRLNAMFDWPRQDLDLFIRVVQQNDYQLSRNKRSSRFDWMSDQEAAAAEAAVRDAFENSGGKTPRTPR
jgi:hypothetical protein